MIKHLVLSGGGHSLFHTFGVLRYLQEHRVWKRSNIQSIYGTSAGGLMGALLCLNYDYDKQEDWDTLQKYLVDRPWHEAFPITTKTFINSYSKRGLFDRGFVETIFKPLFLAKDISMNITMKELYDYSKIDLHVFSFELHKFEVIDISHETHPDLPLLTALHMTSAYPILFSPHISDNGKCYLDGGVKSNYPLDICIKSGKKNEEILGISKKRFNATSNEENKEKEQEKQEDECKTPMTITKSSSILDYIFAFLYKLIKSICTEYKQPLISNEVTYAIEPFSYFHLKNCLLNKEFREKYINEGQRAAENYMVVKN